MRFPDNISLDEIDLHPLKQEDADALYKLTNHPEIAGIISFLTYPVAESFAKEWIEKNQKQDERVYGIFSKTGVLMGQIGAHTANHDEIEIGYWIGVDFKGKGLASKAATGLAKTLAHHNEKNRVIAECLPDNFGSLRVLEKAGFRNTGQPGHRSGRVRFVFSAPDAGLNS